MLSHEVTGKNHFMRQHYGCRACVNVSLILVRYKCNDIHVRKNSSRYHHMLFGKSLYILGKNGYIRHCNVVNNTRCIPSHSGSHVLVRGMAFELVQEHRGLGVCPWRLF